MNICNQINEQLSISEAKALGSAGSLDDLLKLAKEKLYQPNLKFKEEDKGTWSLHNDLGELEAWIVTQKGKRFRIELTGKQNTKRKAKLPTTEGEVTAIKDDGMSISDDYFAVKGNYDTKLKVGDAVEFEYNKYGFAMNVKALK